MRADQLLLQRELATSRSQAQRLIAAGVLWRANVISGAAGEGTWKRIAKNSDDVPDDAQIDLLDASEARYVSRGGLKLEGALRASGVVVTGKTCLDVGQSTGGFTDCLLQHGAKLVVGVDVGQGQLHPAIRDNPQVVAIEQVNARDLDASDLISNYARLTGTSDAFDDDDAMPDALEPSDGFDATFDLIVGDLSFISQTLVLPALAPLLRPGAAILMLVKPQFELQPGQVGKGGIVRDDAMYAVVEARIRTCYAELGLEIRSWFESPIAGGDGNREFFVHAVQAAPLV
jgi:23S rRNA (cytidine1920-2'-O)/16S rRNA (cytidine1409-2'-O)-methyltransferase